MVIELNIEFGLKVAFSGIFTFCVVQIIVELYLSTVAGSLAITNTVCIHA